MKKNKKLTFVVFVILSSLIYSCQGIIWDMHESQVNYLEPLHFLEPNDEFEVMWGMSEISLGYSNLRPTLTGGGGRIILEGLERETYLTGTIMGLDSITGNMIWKIPATGSGNGEKIIQNNILYRGTTGVAVVQAYNIENGELIWQTKLPQAHSVTDIYSAENKIFAYTSDSEFFVLNEKGGIVDSFPETLRVFLEMDGTLYMEDNFAIKAQNAFTRRELWRLEIEDYYTHAPIFENGTILLRTWNNPAYIYSIDQNTGKVNWKVLKDALSNLFVARRKVYFLDFDGCLVTIDQKSGSEISRVEFSPPFDIERRDGGYFVSGDLVNNILVVSFGDNNQIMGLKIKAP